MSNRTKNILIALLAIILLALLGWGTWWGKNKYDEQEEAFTSFKSVVKEKGNKRYDQKLETLKQQFGKLKTKFDQALLALEEGRYYTEDSDNLKLSLEELRSEIETRKNKLDTLYFGSSVDEEALDEFQNRLLDYMEALNEADKEDARIAKQKLKGYQYRLRAYRDSMMLYLDQKRALLDSLQALQGIAQNKSEVEAERDRLLSILDERDKQIDAMTNDKSDYVKQIQSLEDSLAMLLNRKSPIQVLELRCYYTPKEKEKKGQVWLNSQPIHTPNKVREIHIEFETNVPEFTDENKAEILLYFNNTPIKSRDVVISKGKCETTFDCRDDKLEVGRYKLEIQYAGKTIRKHEFVISKPTLF